MIVRDKMAIRIDGTITHVDEIGTSWALNIVGTTEGISEKFSLTLESNAVATLFTTHKLSLHVIESFTNANGVPLLMFGKSKDLVISATPNGAKLTHKAFEKVSISIDIE